MRTGDSIEEKLLQRKVAEISHTKTLNSCFIMCFKPEGENFVIRRSGEGSENFLLLMRVRNCLLCTEEGYWEKKRRRKWIKVERHVEQRVRQKMQPKVKEQVRERETDYEGGEEKEMEMLQSTSTKICFGSVSTPSRCFSKQKTKIFRQLSPEWIHASIVLHCTW